MKEKSESGGGYVRADQIDLKSLDEQLQRHLSKAWTMEKNQSKKEHEDSFEDHGGHGHGHGQQQQQLSKPIYTRSRSSSTSTTVRRQEWEIDPSKLIIKGAIARGTFGSVHRGFYDGQDVAGISSLPIFVIFVHIISYSCMWCHWWFYCHWY